MNRRQKKKREKRRMYIYTFTDSFSFTVPYKVMKSKLRRLKKEGWFKHGKSID